MRLGPVVLERKGKPGSGAIKVVSEPGPAMRRLEEILTDFEIVDVNEGAILVVDPKEAAQRRELTETRQLTTPTQLDFRELGTSTPSSYSSFGAIEYNSEMRGWSGLRNLDRMRRSDGQVAAVLRLIKTPVLAARWYMEPASDSPQDKMIAEFIWKNLTKWMTVSFPQFMIEALLQLDFGWYAFEKVFTPRIVDGELRVCWQKFAPRHPMDLFKWDMDANGGPNGAVFYAPEHALDSVFIPIGKLLVFTHNKETGNMEGISALRPGYKHWFYKENLYKIDAIQKERHGIGIPVIKLPPNFNASDKALADEMGRNLRTNEKAHIVAPPNWEIIFAKLEGHVVDALASIEHHDLLIARSVLGQFLNNQTASSQEEQQTLFLKSTRFIADQFRDVLNKWAIPELVNWNWADIEEYPELKVRRIGDTVDWRTISFAIRNFVGAGILVPDDQLEEWVRDEMDLPKPDVSTQRIIVAPQQPGTIPDGAPDGRPGSGGAGADSSHQNGGGIGNRPKSSSAGLPRQSQAVNMKKGVGATNVGTDKSGG